MKSVIKFDIHQSSKVHFLDVTISLFNGTLKTDLYSKPTDSHLYLNTTSSHPHHVIKNIPKGQFIRLRRICSDTADYIKHCSNYINYFQNTGYSKNQLVEISKDVLKLNREELLNEKQKTVRDPNTTFVCNYHPKLELL